MSHGCSMITELLTLVIIFNSAVGRELILNTVVWRHGDRSYTNTYPNDPYKDNNIWRNGYGELTNIGVKQQYELGEYLRSKYSASLDTEYLKEQIYVRSTGKDRTIMSAQSNLGGLYQSVTSNEMWNGTVTAWYPIPVHVVPVEYEDLLSYPRRDCSKYNETMQKIYSSTWFLEHEKRYAEFYKFIEEKTGVPDVNLLNIWTIEDNLFCLQCHNYPLPDWVTDDIMSKLQKLHSLGIGLMFTDIHYNYRKELSQLQGGILLKDIIAKMQQRAKTKDGKYSMISYSAHDTTLVALLVALGNYDWIQPSYASCVMVDLYKDGGKYEVEVQYRRGNGTITLLNVYGCDTSCDLEVFARILQDYVPDDYDKICNEHPESHQTWFGMTFSLTCVILLAVIIGTLVVLR